MSASVGRVASKVGQAATKTAAEAGKAGSGDSVLKKGAKRDPELYVLLSVMTGAFGLVGYYFGRKPTSSSSEALDGVAKDTMPWQVGDAKGDKTDQPAKYQYHPGGDKTKAPKNAPSTLSVVIIPKVTAPKEAHDRFNKYGKEGW